MAEKRQKTRLKPAFTSEWRGETLRADGEGTEAAMTLHGSERPASTERLMEEVCKRENVERALKRVRANKGSPGVDGMTVEKLPVYLKEHWSGIRAQLLEGRYRPQPVKRVEIPKADGGVRKLGIPTALDRFIQQAVMQVLQGRWDGTFSESSYGFRPGRSAHQAVDRAQEYMREGYVWVVDIDLEKFFDRVNHDKVMGHVAAREKDRRVIKLIRAYLNAGVMEDGLVSPTTEGTPQGGPLSPLLSNLMLDVLDRELERRGHRFVRYADDCNIYVQSERAGKRVMESIRRFIETKLKLKVNEGKSAVARPSERKFLGFSFTNEKEPRRRIAPKALERCKGRIKELTSRTNGRSEAQMVKDLTRYLAGWGGYYGHCETPSVLERLDSWIRRRLRSVEWKQWKRGPTRYKELRRRGVSRDLAACTAGSSHGPWRIARSPALNQALPNKHFGSLGLPTLAGRMKA